MEPVSKPGCCALREAVGKTGSGRVILAAKQKGGHIMLSSGDGGAGMARMKTHNGPE